MQIANNKKNFENIVYPELSYKITGILFAVHNELGKYRSEKQYGDAIEKYLNLYHILYEREKVLPPSFEGEQRGRNKADFLIQNKILIEIKARPYISNDDYRQLMRYLVSLCKKLGLLVNFRQRYLRPKRVLNSLAKE